MLTLLVIQRSLNTALSLYLYQAEKTVPFIPTQPTSQRILPTAFIPPILSFIQAAAPFIIAPTLAATAPLKPIKQIAFKLTKQFQSFQSYTHKQHKKANQLHQQYYQYPDIYSKCSSLQ